MPKTDNARHNTDKKYKKAFPKKGFETFDLWGESQFALWSNIRFDFELITELTRYRRSTIRCLEILNTVNNYIKNAPENVFFDGTIKCLKYLVKNKYLNISELPTLTEDEKYLVELLKKYESRLDITDIFTDIEEPTVRGMLLEYPHLFEELLKENDPLFISILSKAMLKNGIKDLETFEARVSNPEEAIEVDKDKYSTEAMKCKLIYVGLRIANNKLFITKNNTRLIGEIESLTDKSIEEGTYSKSTFTSLYVAFYGHDEWGKQRKTHLTGCELLYLDFQLLTLPKNHMSMIYDLFLKEEVDKIGKKYFGEDYRPEGFIASLAIKMVVTILIFRSQDFIPEGEKPEVDFFGKGAMLDGLNYGVAKTDDKQKSLVLKKWFLEYFRNELDKRVAFIKHQIDNSIGLVQFREKIVRVVYLPVFESFRYFCSTARLDILQQIIRLFENRKIDNDIKDDILINLVINIQKIIGVKSQKKEITKEEIYFKDAFIILIGKIFKNLIKKAIGSLLRSDVPTKKYYENQDLFGDADIAIMELILNFTLSKNDSFIGYINGNIYLKIKTSGRISKKSDLALTGDELDEDFWDNLPDGKDIVDELSDRQTLDKISQHIENLPPKQKEAITKSLEDNIKLSDSERKNKNRGLNKIKDIMAKT